MLARSLAAIAITCLACLAAGSAARAQPPGGSAPVASPPVVSPPGHRGIVLGVGLARELLTNRERQSPAGGFELYLGWALGQYALVLWGRSYIDYRDYFHFVLGGALRVWPLRSPRLLRRLYVEGRAGLASLAMPLDCEDGCKDNDRSGAAVGTVLGFELLSTRLFTIDARASLSREILADYEDHTLFDLGLALHFY